MKKDYRTYRGFSVAYSRENGTGRSDKMSMFKGKLTYSHNIPGTQAHEDKLMYDVCKRRVWENMLKRNNVADDNHIRVTYNA